MKKIRINNSYERVKLHSFYTLYYYKVGKKSSLCKLCNKVITVGIHAREVEELVKGALCYILKRCSSRTLTLEPVCVSRY